MIYDKFIWNWPSGSGEEDFFNSSMYFCNFVIIHRLKKAGPFILINLNPYTQGFFVQIFVEIGPELLEKMVFQIC